MLRLLSWLLLALAVSDWRLVSVQDMRRVLDPTHGDGTSGVLSPDGSTIAWTAGAMLCLYTLADESYACLSPYEVDIPLTTPVWSPDSQRIAFTEALAGVPNAPTTSLSLVYESDVWVFDIAQQRLSNISDDGFSGVWNTETDALLNPTIGLDIAPAWNPVTGDLLYFSILQNTLVLYQVTDGIPEQLFVVSFDLNYSLGENPFARLARLSATVSPDGRQIAITWLPAEGDWGLFLLDSARPGRWTHLVEADDLRVGLPTWSEAAMVPYHVEWAHNGLLINGESEGDSQNSLPTMAYFVALPQGAVQPLVDVSNMRQPDASGVIAQLPRDAVVAPDGMTALYIGFDSTNALADVYALALPPAGQRPVLLRTIPDFGCCTTNHQLSRSDSGQVLSYGYLLTYER